MPYIQTKGGQYLTLSYDPTASLVKRGKAVSQMIAIGPEPIEVTQDQARALVGTNPESLRYSDDQHEPVVVEEVEVEGVELVDVVAAVDDGESDPNSALIELQKFIDKGGSSNPSDDYPTI